MRYLKSHIKTKLIRTAPFASQTSWISLLLGTSLSLSLFYCSKPAMGDKPLVDDIGDGMQCTDHPYRTNQAGICAFCLQERLGKLVSSSKSKPFFPLPTSSSSSPPSLRSTSAADDRSLPAAAAAGDRTQIPFLSTKKKKNINISRKIMAASSSTSSSSSSSAANIYVLKRSKSVAPRPLGGLTEAAAAAADSPRKKGFWSFLYLSSSPSLIAKRRSTDLDLKQQEKDHTSVEETGAVLESPASSSFGRKVSRSRSVGCGSRSFSGDFLERISFGDCTLRRVESQREAKPKTAIHDDEERVKCGGLFGGFGVVSSSSSSYWISDLENAGRLSTSKAHGRSKSWGWAAFASPMRAFRPAYASKSYVITAPSGGSMNGGNSKMGANPLVIVGS